jgi:hypothetical protein
MRRTWSSRALTGLVLAAAAVLLVAGPAGAHPVGAHAHCGLLQQMWDACEYVETRGAGSDAAAEVGPGETVSRNVKLLANLPKSGPFAGESAFGSDLAFSGAYAINGNYNGFQITDISEPEAPRIVSQVSCPGSQNDVSVFRNLIVTSTDSQRNKPECENNGPAQTGGTIWEGIRIFDWSDPAKPVYKGAVLTDCGSHTHTLVPDLANDRLLVYVSSYGPGANLNCLPPHDKISIVSIPLSDPGAARVIAEPVLFPTGGQTSTSGCHDITAYPAIGLAAGACMGEGIILDISNPAEPEVLSTVTDPNFSFWHSATFSNDGDTVIFTDELGGGTAARCTTAYGPNRGADAIYDISNPRAPVFLSYFKIPRFQTTTENCVSHNGSLIPSKDRDLFVQAWYQGGTSVIDFTDPRNPKEIGWFDRGPINETRIVAGGHWSSYWYNGKIYANEIQRGLDVLLVSGLGGGFKLPYFNAQTQEPF